MFTKSIYSVKRLLLLVTKSGLNMIEICKSKSLSQINDINQPKYVINLSLSNQISKPSNPSRLDTSN